MSLFLVCSYLFLFSFLYLGYEPAVASMTTEQTIISFFLSLNSPDDIMSSSFLSSICVITYHIFFFFFFCFQVIDLSIVGHNWEYGTSIFFFQIINRKDFRTLFLLPCIFVITMYNVPLLQTYYNSTTLMLFFIIISLRVPVPRLLLAFVKVF
jgi:hypothetical protein